MISDAQPMADFQDRGIMQAGELYLPVREALAFVSHCEEAGLAVMGAEAFTRHEGRLEPRLDLIADASGLEAGTWRTFREKSNAFIRSFLEGMGAGEDVVINLTVLSEDEWT